MKKACSMFLAVSLLYLILLAGCSGKATQTNTQQITTAVQTGASTAQPAGDNTPKPKLKILLNYLKGDYNEYPVSKVLQERTGYEIEYVALPAENPMDKVNLVLASGEVYDLIKITNPNITLRATYSDFARKGAITEIGGLMDQYGANIKKDVSQKSFDDFTVDGKIYFIPTKKASFNPAGSIGNGILIRTDWLKAVGLKKPKTVDEFVNVLKAFKEKDPGGNGAKNIPFTISKDSVVINGLSGAFGFNNDWIDVDGKLVASVTTQGFKDYITFMNDLYNQGLLDAEFPMNTSATVQEKFTGGKAGVIPLTWANAATVLAAFTTNNPNGTYDYLDPLPDKNGKQTLRAVYGYDAIFFIPSVSKNAADVIKWVNAEHDPDTFKEVALGVEGTHYTYQNGQYNPFSPKFFDERSSANNYLVGIDETNYASYWLARLKKDPKNEWAYTYLNIDHPEWADVDPLSVAPIIDSYVKFGTDLSELLTANIKFVAGAQPLSEWDSFVATWKSSGGSVLEKDLNVWYNGLKK